MVWWCETGGSDRCELALVSDDIDASRALAALSVCRGITDVAGGNHFDVYSPTSRPSHSVIQHHGVYRTV